MYPDHRPTALNFAELLVLMGGGGRPAAFSPAALPGYIDSPFSVATMRGGGALWQDTGKTVPATADGDPVRVANCGAPDWTAPTDAARPLLWDEGGGKWSLFFDGVDDILSWTASGFVVAMSNYSLAASIVPLSTNGGVDKTWLAKGFPGGNVLAQIGFGPAFGSTLFRAWSGSGFAFDSIARPAISDGVAAVVGFGQRSGGATLVCRTNGGEATSPRTLTQTDTSQTLTVGGAAGGDKQTMRLRGLSVYSSALTGAEWTLLETFLGGL